MPEIELPGGPAFPFQVHVGDDTVTWYRLGAADGESWTYVAMVDDVVQVVNDSYDVREGFAGDVRMALCAWAPSAIAYREHTRYWTEQVHQLIRLETDYRS